MIRYFLSLFASSLFVVTQAQKPIDLITSKEANRIISVLASDDMHGRKTFSKDIDKAADFISNEFKSIGLQTLNNNGSYKQAFTVSTAKQISLTMTSADSSFDPQRVVILTFQPAITVTEKSGYKTATIKAGGNFFTEATKFTGVDENMIVLVDTSYRKNFSRLSGLKRNAFKTKNTVIFILDTQLPSIFSINATHEITDQQLGNVVGVIPGRSKKNEYVIFSGHYDHLGIGKAVNGDSIYNGANDDAAGTTAVIMLAKYYKALKNNERTIVFAAFTAEEIGGYGSKYFSKQFDADKVMAMFNIEMIGTDSKWGKNSAYITGYEKTNMGTILQKNLEGTGFTFYPDPYTTQNLFYRSDNATLARLGVPAHTISTSKMDTEPNYHKASDEVATLDMDNMAMIIRSVALSAKSIVDGKEAPSRVNVNELR